MGDMFKMASGRGPGAAGNGAGANKTNAQITKQLVQETLMDEGLRVVKELASQIKADNPMMVDVVGAAHNAAVTISPPPPHLPHHLPHHAHLHHHHNHVHQMHHLNHVAVKCRMSPPSPGSLQQHQQSPPVGGGAHQNSPMSLTNHHHHHHHQSPPTTNNHYNNHVDHQDKMVKSTNHNIGSSAPSAYNLSDGCLRTSNNSSPTSVAAVLDNNNVNTLLDLQTKVAVGAIKQEPPTSPPPSAQAEAAAATTGLA